MARILDGLQKLPHELLHTSQRDPMKTVLPEPSCRLGTLAEDLGKQASKEVPPDGGKRKVYASQQAVCIKERSPNSQASKGLTKGPQT
eukprot:scaffold153309_cov19-Tisochrysis_lutea.AAC.1